MFKILYKHNFFFRNSRQKKWRKLHEKDFAVSFEEISTTDKIKIANSNLLIQK